MAESNESATRPSASASPPPPPIKKRPAAFRFPILVLLVAAAARFVVPLISPSFSQQQKHHFVPADVPADAYARPITFPIHDARLLRSIQKVGDGILPGPEDLAYDAEEQVLYTGCSDGVIRRLHLTDAKGKEFRKPLVEDWVRVGGRPLGVALAPVGENGVRRLYVADAVKGLIAVDPPSDGIGAPKVTLLATGADGVPFGLTDGVDVADDGMVYFTDASSKYGLDEFTLDLLEGRPYGRLMSYDPETNDTKVLVDGLYFANGVVVAPGGGSVVFCESFRSRCSRYFREGQGDKEGTVEVVVDRLPGLPDNIRYNDDGTYMIALFSGRSWAWNMIVKYPWIRKALLTTGFQVIPVLMSGSGVAEVGLDGELISLRTDFQLQLITAGVKAGKHLYLGALLLPHVGRIQLPDNAASS